MSSVRKGGSATKLLVLGTETQKLALLLLTRGPEGSLDPLHVVSPFLPITRALTCIFFHVRMRLILSAESDDQTFKDANRSAFVSSYN